MDRSAFLRLVKQHFPELREAMNAQHGQFGSEIEEFQKFTFSAVLKGDRAITTRCFEIADEAFRTGDRKFRGAINGRTPGAIDVCFVEHFEFRLGDGREWAWEIMPASLQHLWADFHVRVLGRDRPGPLKPRPKDMAILPPWLPPDGKA